MEDQPPVNPQPPQIPAGAESNPYASPDQPPMLPQQHAMAHVDGNGLTQDDKTMGMLVHLLSLLTGFIGVLIIWLVKKDQSKFVDYHGREALNFLISIFIYMVGLMLVGVLIGVATMGIGMIFIFPIIAIIGIGQLVFEIMACVAAHKGEWYRYPMTIRLIPSVS